MGSPYQRGRRDRVRSSTRWDNCPQDDWAASFRRTRKSEGNRRKNLKEGGNVKKTLQWASASHQ